MNSAIQQARERAQDFMAANPAVQHVVVLYTGGHLIRDRAGNEAIKPMEPNHADDHSLLRIL